MKRRHYYVVEIEFFQGNFRHKAIMYYEGERYDKRYGTLYSIGYEGRKEVVIEELHYFNCVSEIKEMRGEGQ